MTSFNNSRGSLKQMCMHMCKALRDLYEDFEKFMSKLWFGTQWQFLKVIYSNWLLMNYRDQDYRYWSGCIPKVGCLCILCSNAREASDFTNMTNANFELSWDPADKKPHWLNYLKTGNKNKIEGVTQTDCWRSVKTELCADLVWYNLTFLSENIENVNV